jgi:MFS family permease
MASATFRALRERNARWFFAGILVSNVGSWVQLTAMSLLVYRLSGSATPVGVTIALQFLPMLVLGAWAGALADRQDRRRLALITETGMALQAFALGITDLAGWVSIPVVYLASFVLGVLGAINNPARRGFVTELVAPDEITNAMALNTATMTGSRVIGPALAAVLLGPLGTGWLFILNGVSFAAILTALARMDLSRLYPSERAPAGGRPVREALSWVRRDPVMAPIFVVFAVVSTFGFNYNVVLPKLADDHWGGDHWFGWLLASVSLGMVTGALVTARRTVVSVAWFWGNAALVGVSCIAMAVAPHLAIAFVVSLPLGFSGAVFIAAMNGITQNRCPGVMRGRMMALTAVAFLGSTPIGGPISGWVADNVGTRWSLAYGGIVTLVTVAVVRRPLDDAPVAPVVAPNRFENAS